MKLFLISQNENNRYDTYDSAVVVAANSDEARLIHPDGYTIWLEYRWVWGHANGEFRDASSDGTWTVPAKVSAEYIGEAAEHLSVGAIVCSSFNAG